MPGKSSPIVHSGEALKALAELGDVLLAAKVANRTREDDERVDDVRPDVIEDLVARLVVFAPRTQVSSREGPKNRALGERNFARPLDDGRLILLGRIRKQHAEAEARTFSDGVAIGRTGNALGALGILFGRARGADPSHRTKVRHAGQPGKIGAPATCATRPPVGSEGGLRSGTWPSHAPKPRESPVTWQKAPWLPASFVSSGRFASKR